MPTEAGVARKSMFLWCLAGLLFVTAIFCAVIGSSRPAPERFVWMTPDKLARTLKPGRLTLLKYKVLRWPGPWRWFKSRKTVIQIDARLLTVSNAASFAVDNSIPCHTNREGVRAWIVPPEELVRLKQETKSLAGVAQRNAMRLTTIDGGQAQISDATVSGGAFCGLVVNVLPRLAKGSFKSLVGATSTETNSVGTLGPVHTNISFASQALLPNGGALVIAGNGEGISGSNHWLIISTVAVDATGKPIRLGN